MSNLNEKRFEHWEQQKEFRDEMEGDMKKLTADMIKLQNNLQIHTENYNQYIRRIIEIDKKHNEFVERFDEYMQRSEPMLKWFEEITVGRKLLLYGFSILVAIVSIALMIKQLLK